MFTIAKVLGQGNSKGISFPDGTVMLSRQGSSSTVNGYINNVFVEARITSSPVSCTLFYQEGQGAQHNASGKYYFDHTNANDRESDRLFPISMIQDVFNFVELHRRVRPQGIRQQVLAYMYGWGNEKGDIILSPFRYTEGSIIHTKSATPVAVLVSAAAESTKFEISMVSLLDGDDVATVNALNKAVRIGFHQCDTKKGADYCMRRLAWLAGCYYLEQFIGQEVDVFVLSASDMETPAELVPPTLSV